MTTSKIEATPKPERAFMRRDGRIYFSRQTERKLFFILTLVMLVVGILYRLRCGLGHDRRHRFFPALLPDDPDPPVGQPVAPCWPSCSPEAGWSRPLGMLVVSSLLFAGACVIAQPGPQPVYLGLIYFANAVGMTLIAAGAGLADHHPDGGAGRSPSGGFVTIYALAAGITLLASWVPGLVLLTEAWKWWLIGTGMTRGLGLPRRQALTVVAISIALIILLFWSLQNAAAGHRLRSQPPGGVFSIAADALGVREVEHPPQESLIRGCGGRPAAKNRLYSL